jgi:hypothetical protein
MGRDTMSKPKRKDPAAVALGKKRWAKITQGERQQIMRDLARRRWSRKGRGR